MWMKKEKNREILTERQSMTPLEMFGYAGCILLAFLLVWIISINL